MERIEYKTKTDLPAGPWNDEPDKIQWSDKATGLPCLIVRNNSGALCGYVGVKEGHPAFKTKYQYVDVDVHGGLTFADHCHDVTGGYEKIESRRKAWAEEAVRYPIGDAAKRLRDWADVTNQAEYEKRVEATAICHIDPDDKRPVWWLGFDCAHSGDFSPAYGDRFGSHMGEQYRDIDYVERQVAYLAKQLSEMR